MFASLPTPLQFLLASQVQPCKVPPGHDVTTQGATASNMYLLDYGQVRLACPASGISRNKLPEEQP